MSNNKRTFLAEFLEVNYVPLWKIKNYIYETIGDT